MPVVVAWIGEMLISYIGQIVISAMLSLGIGLLAQKVGSAVFDSSPIKAAMGSAGQTMMAYAGWFGIDKAITIVLSAWMGRKATDAARISFVKRSAGGK